jgi:hypothetical protein
LDTKSASAEKRFARIVDALSGDDGVTVGGGKRGFGSDALQVNGKIFAMLRRGALVVKLPAARVAELISAGVATPFDAGKGRPMREWATLDERAGRRWLSLGREALAYNRSRD